MAGDRFLEYTAEVRAIDAIISPHITSKALSRSEMARVDIGKINLQCLSEWHGDL
jgi:hypothetical protein